MFLGHPTFLCLQYELSYGNTLDHICASLKITDPSFWDEEDDDMQFAPAQAAAVIAVMAAVAGGVATVHLVSASCFELPPQKLLFISIVEMVCAVFTFISIFVASGVDPCKKMSNACERHKLAGIRLEEGSVAAIFAAFFYGWAAITVIHYRHEVVRDAQGTPTSTPAGIMHQRVAVQENAPMIHKSNNNNGQRSIGENDSDTDVEMAAEMAAYQMPGMKKDTPEPSGIYGSDSGV